MKLGMIGLGKMGANMVRRLLQGKHQVVVYNRTAEKSKAMAAEGAAAAFSIDDFLKGLEPPKVVWLMVPSGQPVDDMLIELIPKLSKGDIVIDGGNSHYTESVRRYNQLKSSGINFLDVGTSGGVWGLKEGYCMMIGGDENVFKTVEPILKTLAPPGGYAYMGGAGAGHYVKMVHNGIEYGMLEAYGEGFEILKASDYNLDLKKISELWNHGSVVRSWLLELAADAFEKDPKLAGIKGYVDDTGEGRWTIEEAIRRSIPAPIITMSLLARFRSRQDDSFSAKVIAALRNEFGGHTVKEKE